MKPINIDSHGRRLRKLRVSLLDACNFRCLYCMPDKVNFTHQSKWLNPKQIKDICSTLVGFGLEQIRITGGEPTLRKDFREIVSSLSRLPLQKLALTSNGLFLEDQLHFLKSTTCTHINISLDSINPDNFFKITKNKHHDRVIRSILQAKEMDFDVKINTVLLKGINDHELLDLVAFASKYDIEIRFIELMKIGIANLNFDKHFISAKDAIYILQKHHTLHTQISEFDSTSFNYISSTGSKIGFIASESQPFCTSCSRLRLSATGILRACLMSEKGADLINLDPSDYEETFKKVIQLKPYERIENIQQHMNQIGG